MNYIDADRLKAEIEKNTPDTLQLLVYRDIILALIDSLQQEQDLIIINKKDWEAQEQFRKNKDFGKPLQKEQDYSDLSDLERAIHRGFLCAGVENVPVAIIKETAKEAMADLERTFEFNPDKLPIWLKNGLAKKHLDGYIMGREDTMREMKDFIESHFNCEKAKEPNPPAINIPTWAPPCYYGGPCTNPFKDCINCPRANVVIEHNTTSGTSTSKAEG